MAKVKQSNFELLKVVAMLMIVCHHLITQNAFNIDTQLTGLNPSRVFLQLIGNHAFVGNNLLFMVSVSVYSCRSVSDEEKHEPHLESGEGNAIL